LHSLKHELDRGDIAEMRPFGTALDHSLKNARLAPGGWVTWEEEDYCRPPLAMERQAVLDRYFVDLDVTKIERGEGWKRLIISTSDNREERALADEQEYAAVLKERFGIVL